MSASSINKLIENLKIILSKDSNDIAEVLKLLNLYEKKGLQSIFGNNIIKLTNDKNESSELIFKAEAINSIIYVLINNPQFISVVEESKDKNTNTENVLKKLYIIASDLYRNYFESYIGNDYIEHLSILVLFCFYAIIADKQTISDIIVKQCLDNFIDKIKSELNPINKLQANTYLILVAIVCKIRDANAVKLLTNLIDETEQILLNVQELELKNEDFDINNAMTISGLANIIYISKSIKTFLFTGMVDSNSEWDIYSYIDTYCFNSIKLLENIQDENLKKIANLLKYALEQVCRNSIWSIASKSPAIKKFFENCLSSENNLIYTLLPSQRDTILDILTTKKSILLNMPTSSGKSLLAELYILFTIHNFTTETTKPTVCYIVPTNALINQVSNKLRADFNEFGYNIETVLPFYDLDDIEEEILNSEHIDILVSTPEKLDLLIRRDHKSLKNLKLIILDEAHNLAEEKRGSKFELLLATIKQRKRDVNYLLLSPFIKNAENISQWLGDTKQDSVSISLEWTPTKQYIGCNLLNSSKTKSSILYFPSDRNNIVKEPIEVDLNINPQELKELLNEQSVDYKVKNIAIIEKYINLGTVMVLCQGANSCQKLAVKAAEYFKQAKLLPYVGDNYEIRKAIELISLESSEDDDLIKCIEVGIAYHHAKLSALVKEAIEKLLRNNLIKVICATTTLAQGMNFPITTIIFDTVQVGGGSNIRELSGPEFWNIAGRAGRAYMDKEGHVLTPYLSTQKNTKNKCIEYIKHSINDVNSTLTEFFEKLGDDVIFNYDFIKNNIAASNFLQYLNHILNVSFNYNIDTIDTAKIRNILNTSLFYKELSFKKGFIESQQKINNFSLKYIKHLKGETTKQLKLADFFGVSDISCKTFSGLVYGLKQEILQEVGEERKDDYLKASKIILESKDALRLSRIIDIISKIPEIKMELYGRGEFNPESVSKIVIGWVNGKKVNEIAREIQYENTEFNEVLGKCFQFVNSKLKSFVPWGISIYQMLTDDTSNDKSKNLPSYIYYGVNDSEAVILSKVGVPRFAVDNVKRILANKHPNISINVENINVLKQTIKSIEYTEYSFEKADSKIVKKIIDGYL